MFWEILLTCIIMTAFCLLVFIVINWEDLHTIGDFLAPISEDKVDSVVLYIPAVNLVVTAVVLAYVICMLVEKALKSKCVSKLFSPLRKFFEIKVK